MKFPHSRHLPDWPPAIALALLLFAAPALAAGDSPAQRKLREVTGVYLDALKTGDAGMMWDTFSAATRQALGGDRDNFAKAIQQARVRGDIFQSFGRWTLTEIGDLRFLLATGEAEAVVNLTWPNFREAEFLILADPLLSAWLRALPPQDGMELLRREVPPLLIANPSAPRIRREEKLTFVREGSSYRITLDRQTVDQLRRAMQPRETPARENPGDQKTVLSPAERDATRARIIQRLKTVLGAPATGAAAAAPE
ncbi:MAG: hypothetical protein GMKNLPBB_02591 [Myxococcota bacterium]|nr:hypothetical protein [Myxococcota bacterium]